MKKLLLSLLEVYRIGRDEGLIDFEAMINLEKIDGSVSRALIERGTVVPVPSGDKNYYTWVGKKPDDKITETISRITNKNQPIKTKMATKKAPNEITGGIERLRKEAARLEGRIEEYQTKLSKVNQAIEAAEKFSSAFPNTVAELTTKESTSERPAKNGLNERILSFVKNKSEAATLEELSKQFVTSKEMTKSTLYTTLSTLTKNKRLARPARGTYKFVSN